MYSRNNSQAYLVAMSLMFSFVQENIVANFLESKDIDVATKAVKDIKGPRYVAGCVFNNLMPFEK